MGNYTLRIKVNSVEYSLNIDPYETLNRVLRERLGLTGTKRGCDYGGCGSCTALVDGKAVYSCMYPALKAEGKEVTTIEGLSKGEELDSLQKAFLEHGGLQCGYCTPGFIMSAKALTLRNPDPSERDIRYALSGNICRCTGYSKILESVKAATQNPRTTHSP